MRHLSCTNDLMLLNNRSFSQDFPPKNKLANEIFILGTSMSISLPNVTIGNRDNVSNESSMSKAFVMRIVCLKNCWFSNLNNHYDCVID